MNGEHWEDHGPHLCIGGLNGSRQGLHAVNALCGVTEARLDGHVPSGPLLLHVGILGCVDNSGPRVRVTAPASHTVVYMLVR